MMKIDLRFLLSFLILVCVSCSDNSTGSENGYFGELTMTVTGDVVGERSGHADFWGMDLGSTHTWEISSNDLSPQTFSLTFMHMSIEPITQPGTGTYAITDGLPAAAWEDPKPMEFMATYTHIENQDYAGAVEYGTLLCAAEFSSGGTLNITSSSAEEVSGNFKFTAHHADISSETGQCELYGTIHAEGSFTAPARRFQ